MSRLRLLSVFVLRSRLFMLRSKGDVMTKATSSECAEGIGASGDEAIAKDGPVWNHSSFCGKVSCVIKVNSVIPEV